MEHAEEVHEQGILETPRHVSTAKLKPPLTEQEIMGMKKPKVLIVGAGLGGVTLGILLERAGIPYQIYEGANQVKPLGSAMGIGPNILPCLKQLGIFEDFLQIAKPMVLAHSYDNNMKVTQVTDWSVRDTLYGNKYTLLTENKSSFDS
ncbi:hypothetical protein BGZ82_003673 [Podila clonocystis]|nr:hypothetical protein BGZ82_003673 [Podila clonocystis]